MCIYTHTQIIYKIKSFFFKRKRGSVSPLRTGWKLNGMAIGTGHLEEQFAQGWPESPTFVLTICAAWLQLHFLPQKSSGQYSFH